MKFLAYCVSKLCVEWVFVEWVINICEEQCKCS